MMSFSRPLDHEVVASVCAQFFFLFSGFWSDCPCGIAAAKELIVPLPDEGRMNMED